jgi:serine protease
MAATHSGRLKLALWALVLPLVLTPATSPASGMAGTTQLLLKFRPSTTGDVARRTLTQVGAQRLRKIPQLGVEVVRVPSPTAARALQGLRGSTDVAYAEVDAVLKPQELLPSDPYFPQTFSLSGGAWGWYKTRTTQAWDVTKGDPGTVVAVLDTGLRDVTDFGGQTVAGWNVLTGSTDTSTNAGVHGTYVAGVVALADDNSVGNAGYCPGCRVMPVQVGTDSGAYISDVASGIAWAADHGARVENLSLAGSSSSSTLTNAVSYARSKGVVVVAAAGNSNCNCPTYPAATPGVIGVAGTNTVDQKQGDSNFGSWVALAAPEGNMTAWPTINGSPGYAPVGGTSLAAPVVSAIAGLLFSYNKTLSGSQVEEALESSAVPMSFVEYGRVDSLSALGAVGATDPQPASAPTELTPPVVLASTNSGADTAGLTSAPQVGQVLVRGQGAWTGSAPLSLAAVEWQRCASSCTTVASGAKYTVQAGDTGYSLRVRVTVQNGIGSTAAVSPATLPIGGATTATAPVNTVLPAISGTPQEGLTLSADMGMWSGSPTIYTYQWFRCDSMGTTCGSVAGASAVSYTLTSGDVGSTMRVAVTATNVVGSARAMSAATATVASSPVPPPSTQKVTFSGSLSQKNPTRTFSVSVGAGVADARLSFSKCSSLSLALSTGGAARGPSVVVLDANLTAGSYTYTISGGRCSFTLTVTSPTS